MRYDGVQAPMHGEQARGSERIECGGNRLRSSASEAARSDRTRKEAPTRLVSSAITRSALRLLVGQCALELLLTGYRYAYIVAAGHAQLTQRHHDFLAADAEKASNVEHDANDASVRRYQKPVDRADCFIPIILYFLADEIVAVDRSGHLGARGSSHGRAWRR